MRTSRGITTTIDNVLNRARSIEPLIITGRRAISPKYFYGEDYRSLPTFYEKAEPHRDKLWTLVREVRDNPSEMAYQNLEDLLANIRAGTRIPDRHIFWPGTKEIRYRLPNGFELFNNIPTDAELIANPALKDEYLNLMLLRNNLVYLPVPTSDMVRTSLRLAIGAGPKVKDFRHEGLTFYPGEENNVLHINVLPGGKTMSDMAITSNNDIIGSLPTGTAVSAFNDTYPIHYLRENGMVSDKAIRNFIIHGNTKSITAPFYDDVYSTNMAMILGKLASLPNRIHIPALGARATGFNFYGHTIPGLKDKIYIMPNGWQMPGVELAVDDPRYQAFTKRFDIIKEYPDYHGLRMVDLDGNEYLRDVAAYNKRISSFFDPDNTTFSLRKIVRDNRVDEYNKSFGNDYHFAITFDEAGNPIYPYVNVMTMLRKGGKMLRLIPRLKR